MKEIVSTITSKGQITLPAEVRSRLGVGQGDKLSFVVGEDGRIFLKALDYPSIASLAGAAGKLARPIPWNEARAIAREERQARRS